MQELKRAIQWFTREKKIMSCLSVTCGDLNHAYCESDGYTDIGKTQKISDDSLFDLASLTKLFTGLTVMCLYEEGKLDLNRAISDYAPQFIHLHEVSVENVLGFEVLLRTNGRIDHQLSFADAERCLFETRAYPLDEGRYYSDIHSLVLTYVVENVAGIPFENAVKKYVLEPCGMLHTYAHVPEQMIGNCIDYSFEHRIEGENWITRQDIKKGVPHDPKAMILMNGNLSLCGHAGLFSTRNDMQLLCQNVLKGKVVSKENLLYMSRNRTGRMLENGTYTQFLGCQCYVRHPQQYYSEIPVYMSDNAIGLSGFTGNHISIDPTNNIFALFLGNRVQNRLTVLLPPKGKKITDYGLNEDGSGSIIWNNGEKIWSSVNYVHHKDEMLHRQIARLLNI